MRRRSASPGSASSPRLGRVLLLELAALCWSAAAHAADVSEVGRQFKAVVAQYEQLVAELNLNQLPGNLFNYPTVTEQLDRLGGRLEPLSRAVLQADQLAPAAQARLADDIAALSRAIALLRRQSLALRVWGYYHGREDVRRPRWGLATASPGVHLSGAVADCDATAGGEVALGAARGETEAAQLVVVPLDGELKEVRGVVAELRGPDTTLSASALSCQPVDMTDDARPLLPPGSVVVPEGKVQVLWLTVSVPRDQKPGVYKGTVKVQAAGHSSLAARVELRVWNCTLPAEPGLPIAAALDFAADRETARQRGTELLAQYRCRVAEAAPAGALAVPAVEANPRRWGRQAWAELAPGLWCGVANEGEGALLAPGPAGQPLPTRRLELLRDASEDYDLLRLLDAAAADHPEADALRREAAALSAKADEAQWEALRRRLGTLLEELAPKATGTGA